MKKFKKITLTLYVIATGLLSSPTLHAGEHTDSLRGDYDADTGVYVQLVKLNSVDEANRTVIDSVSKSGYYHPNINLFVYNPQNNVSRHLLDNNYGEITSYVIESAFENGSFSYLATNQKVQNNLNIAKRNINQNILIETFNAKTKTHTVWKANKLIGSAKVIFSYQAPSDWHVDAKNQVIRLVTPFVQNKQPQLKVTNFAW